MSHRILNYDDGPLVWIDCEMTGLNYDTDRLLEIAVIITDGRLEPVDEGIEYIIQTPKEVLDKLSQKPSFNHVDGMDEWCTTTHGESGLTQACIDSPHTLEAVSQTVLDYVKRHIPDRGSGLLAGSSVHADLRFLYKYMPDLVKHLSYRILDVSSVKEICRRWHPSVTEKERAGRTGKVAHRALDDIRGSIRELKFYQENIFIPLEPPKDKSKQQPSEKNELDELVETLNKAW
ncbi:ribonuclease H-like domain-containing protein [Kockovaella imperatae]|uniref:Ribonuclease H-like domain-containing protein n=1 Tax=Kockovaella imperatae TaxID=4999 RepID=A0A1Y1UE64_9TREE|nr:ribonuclease H-like domain-containing protein [Kockovaella imperatae]ORX35796.1 ribonuclease H-like domain-containing protein [Kockovaella imperatae]